MARRSATGRRSTRRSPGDGARPDASSSWARTSPAARARRARTTPGAACSASPRASRPAFPGRVLDTPISERAFIGAAAGAAATGLRPVAELMFVDFMGVCFDQIFNQAAKFRYMFGGKAVTPVVIRTMYGAGFRAASQHSQCLYPIFTHIPGLKVVVPSNAYDAKGLLIQAIRDDDPVIFFEHKVMYDDGGRGAGRALRDPVRRGQRHARGRRRHHRRVRPDGELRRAGRRQARRARASQCEVVDPRTTSPLDTETILESVEGPAGWSSSTRRTRAAAWRPTSSALVAQEAFGELKAPTRMVTPPHTPVPFSPALEDALRPERRDKIEAAVARGRSGSAADERARSRRIVMPKWGLAMQEGMLAAWHVEEGARSATGHEIADIETTKIANVFESPVAGRAAPARGDEGETVPVGAPARRGRRRERRRRRDRRLRRRVPGELRRPAEADGRRPPSRDGRGRRPHAALPRAGRGAATPVVFLHGFGGDLNNWLFNQPALAERRAPSTRSTCPAMAARPRRSGDGDVDALAGAVRELPRRLGARARAPRRPLAGRRRRRAAGARPSRPRRLARRWSPAPGSAPEIDGDYIDGFIAAEQPARAQARAADAGRRPGAGDARAWSRTCSSTSASTASTRRCARSPSTCSPAGASRPWPLALGELDVPAARVWGAQDRIIPAAHAARPRRGPR